MSLLPGLDRPPQCGDIEDRYGRATPLIGIDEAGRGPLAGPVVVAACSLPPNFVLPGLDDSKRLTAKKREALFAALRASVPHHAIVTVDVPTIDTLNILQASLHGMALAWEALVDAAPELRTAQVLIDGRDRAPLPDEISQEPIIQGDHLSLHIAAASILAKVTRDRLMQEYHALYPAYGFDRHKGYPTAAHREAIAIHGPSPIHRRSFRLPARRT